MKREKIYMNDFESMQSLIEDAFRVLSFEFYNFDDDGNELVERWDKELAHKNVEYYNSDTNFLNKKNIDIVNYEEFSALSYDTIYEKYLSKIMSKLLALLRKGFCYGSYFYVDESVSDELLKMMIIKHFKDSVLNYLYIYEYRSYAELHIASGMAEHKIVGTFLDASVIENDMTKDKSNYEIRTQKIYKM